MSLRRRAGRSCRRNRRSRCLSRATATNGDRAVFIWPRASTGPPTISSSGVGDGEALAMTGWIDHRQRRGYRVSRRAAQCHRRPTGESRTSTGAPANRRRGCSVSNAGRWTSPAHTPLWALPDLIPIRGSQDGYQRGYGDEIFVTAQMPEKAMPVPCRHRSPSPGRTLSPAGGYWRPCQAISPAVSTDIAAKRARNKCALLARRPRGL